MKYLLTYVACAFLFFQGMQDGMVAYRVPDPLAERLLVAMVWPIAVAFVVGRESERVRGENMRHNGSLKP